LLVRSRTRNNNTNTSCFRNAIWEIIWNIKVAEFYLIHWAVLLVIVMRVLDVPLAYHPGREYVHSARQLIQTDPVAGSAFYSTTTTSPFSRD